MSGILGNALNYRGIAFLAAGFVSHGPTPGGVIYGNAGMMVLGAIVGAFCGLLFGLITTHLCRYISFLMGRNLNGYGWTVLSMVLGAAAFAWMSVANAD